MAILLATRGSLRGLPHSGGKIPCWDGNGDEKSLAVNLVTRTGLYSPPHRFPYPVYIKFYLYNLVTYNMYNINIRVNIVFY